MLINLKKGDFHQILSEDSSTKPSPIKVNLSWDQKPKQTRGFLNKLITNKVPVIDLICKYSTIDGKEGTIMSIDDVGAKDEEPYILIDKTNHTDGSQNSKNLIIYRPEIIKKAMFFATIFDGIKGFKHVDSQLTFEFDNGEQICIELNNCKRNYFICEIAWITDVNSQITITNTKEYVKTSSWRKWFLWL